MLKDLFRIPNHAERAISLLASQFSESVRLKGLISVFSKQIQDLQKALEDLYDYRSLNTAIGQQLDGIGQILNLPRLEGELDEAYRFRLKTRSFIFFSSGTPEQVMEILRVNTGATFVQYYDIFPAAYQLLTNGTNFPDNSVLPPENQINHNQISKLIHEASPAAVQFVPVTATYGVENVFGFSVDLRDNPLIVDDTEEDQPLLATLTEPETYQYYIYGGQFNDEISEGGFADISQYFVLGLDDGGLLELDDGSNLLLFSDAASYDTPGAGQYAEMLYYSE